jgi:hypothetical protein
MVVAGEGMEGGVGSEGSFDSLSLIGRPLR